MTAHKLDELINKDLANLGANSEVNLPSFAEVFKQTEGGAYRDGSAGAEARLDELLARRRTELALLPMAASRIYVHRVSRAASGLVAVLGAITVGVAVVDPLMMRLADFLIPELSLSLALAGLAAAILAAYVVAGWFAERVFEGRMRQSVQTTGDAYKDLDALAEGPIDEARRLARSADTLGLALPIAGVVTNVPLFAFLTLLYAPLWQGSNAWGLRLGMYGVPGSMAQNLLFVALGVAVTLAVVIALATACSREHRRVTSGRLIPFLSHWSVLLVSAIVGLVVMVWIGRLVFDTRFGAMPGYETRAALAVVGTFAVFAPTAWAALWLRRREQTRLRLHAGPDSK